MAVRCWQGGDQIPPVSPFSYPHKAEKELQRSVVLAQDLLRSKINRSRSIEITDLLDQDQQIIDR